MALPEPGGPARDHPQLAAELSRELLPEFPDLAAGRIIAVVVRAIADLRRVTPAADAAGVDEEYRRVVLDIARHQLRRL